MKRFSKFITEKKMTHVIDRKTGESVYGPTDVADAKRYLKKQIQPNKFMIKDIKEDVQLEESYEMRGLGSKGLKNMGKTKKFQDFQNQVKRMSRRDKQKLADKLNDLDLSGYGDYEARVDNVHKFKPSDLKMAMQMMSLKEAPNPEFLKVYDSLKKGDKVEVEFDSGIRKGNKITLVVTSGHRVVGKAKVGRIIMKSPDNMRGVSYTLYNRNGSVSLALGDMATVMKSIKKK